MARQQLIPDVEDEIRRAIRRAYELIMSWPIDCNTPQPDATALDGDTTEEAIIELKDTEPYNSSI